MTYLEIINNVLRRLRENVAETSNETEYSTLIGAFVNDAKEIVENSHSWSALRTEIQFDTVIGTSEYSLTGAGQETEIRDAINKTSKTRFNTRNRSYMNDVYHLRTPVSGPPTEFAFTGTDGNGDIKVKVYPQPDAIYSFLFDAFVPQSALSNDTDVLKVPYNPVVQLAFAMALRERGETGGQSASEQFAIADTILSDAIAFDANKYQEDTTYVAV